MKGAITDAEHLTNTWQLLVGRLTLLGGLLEHLLYGIQTGMIITIQLFRPWHVTTFNIGFPFITRTNPGSEKNCFAQILNGNAEGGFVLPRCRRGRYHRTLEQQPSHGRGDRNCEISEPRSGTAMGALCPVSRLSPLRSLWAGRSSSHFGRWTWCHWNLASTGYTKVDTSTGQHRKLVCPFLAI